MRKILVVAVLGACAWKSAFPVPSLCASSQWDIGYGRMAVTESLAKVCAGIRNSEECARAIERYQAPRYAGRFKRTGRTLTITLENGKSVSLTSSPREVENGYKSYNYIEFLPSIGQHLIEVQLYEGGSFLLVDSKTGTKTEICGVPILSPQCSVFACFFVNLEIGNFIEIWRSTGNGFRRDWRLEPMGWSPNAITWLDEQTFRIEKENWQGGKISYEVYTRRGQNWIRSM